MSDHNDDLSRIPLFDDEPVQGPAHVPPAAPVAPTAWKRMAWPAAAPQPPQSPVPPATVWSTGPTRPAGEFAVRVQSVGISNGLPLGAAVHQVQDQPAPAGRRRADADHEADIDWDQVQTLRELAAGRLGQETENREDRIDEDTRIELARKIILELVSNAARNADLDGRGGMDGRAQQHLATAVFESMFGLGRLQPLVDDDSIENIEIRGHDDVLLIHSDGRIVRGGAVASSDDQLIRDLQFYASRSGSSERPFSPANWNLDLQLPGGHRLSSNAWVSPKPYAVIRRHRLVDVGLQDLVSRDMLTHGQANFLEAAVKAKLSIVTSGPQGAGKTTLTRALANAIPPWESIGTIETEYELLLHEMVERHPRCFAFEARPGSGEKDANGRRLGEVTLDDIMYAVLRKNLSRIIVGEVRGLEVIPMLEAMQAGAGSLSTTHATSARGAVNRLTGLALKGGSHLKDFALTQIAEHVDVIVQIALEDIPTPPEETNDGIVVGQRRRYVSEIVMVEPGEDGRPAFTDVYRAGPNGPEPHLLTADTLTRLAPFGFTGSEFSVKEM